MRRRILVAMILALVAIGLFRGAAAAHTAPPCNDTDGDGSPSGQEYAARHIVPLAQDGALGNDGHVPGSHHGFSACNPSGHQVRSALVISDGSGTRIRSRFRA